MTREIVLDTETTGMNPDTGDRIVEIGCVELVNHVQTGRHLQFYINPERDVPAEAAAVHGLTTEFLRDKPVFSQVYSELIDFIGDSRLVIHNAEFDMKFINRELRNVGHEAIAWNRVTDTLQIARRKFPGSPANLDALCRRFGIDNSDRSFHGALLDSQLLAEVYLELIGGRQHGLGLVAQAALPGGAAEKTRISKGGAVRQSRSFTASAEEIAAHEAMLEKIKNPIWAEGARD